jgi:ribonuclease HI
MGTRRVIAKFGNELGDVSNNVAEYAGILENLKHASRFPAANLIFYVDSMLVAKQINCEWRCASESIKASYEEALALIAGLRTHPSVNNVALNHIYREFNADADGVCNEVLNIPNDARGVRPRQVHLNWNLFCDADADGDIIMRR